MSVTRSNQGGLWTEVGDILFRVENTAPVAVFSVPSMFPSGGKTAPSRSRLGNIAA